MADDRPWRMLVFGDDWGRHPSSSQQLVRGFLADHEVLWVNSVGMRAPRPSLYDLRRVCQRLGAVLRRRPGRGHEPGADPAAGPRVVLPRFLPWHAFAPVRALNRRAVGAQVRRALAATDPAAPLVVYVSNPMAAYLALDQPRDLLVYYCGDDFPELPEVDRHTVARQERALLAAADLVVCSSPALMRKKSPLARVPPEYLPHGVDLARFPYPPPPPPAALAALPHPRVGYFGIFAEWIDLQPLEAAARARPDWQFCLVGEPDARVHELRRLANVHVLGWVPHTQLAAWAGAFDAALLLYHRDHPMTNAINPLKMLECYALGLPVASTRSLDDIAGAEFLFIGRDDPGFLAAIGQALAAEVPFRDRLRAFAAAGDWTARRASLRAWIAAALARRGA